jgi:hypothetical protein
MDGIVALPGLTTILSMRNEITCATCGHTEWWEDGNYFGEKVDMDHHWCGKPGQYRPCGPECDHSYPGCALDRADPSRYAGSN